MKVVLMHLLLVNIALYCRVLKTCDNFRALIACEIALCLRFCRFFRLSLKIVTSQLNSIKTIFILL